MKVDIAKITQAAVITALIFVLDITGLGYIPLSVATVSIISIPVCVGAVTMGPGWGAFFGGVFGLSSFLQCFGKSAFGTLMLSLNPFFAAIVCFIPRILTGFLCGVIFKYLYAFLTRGGKNGKENIAFVAAGVSAPLLNTVLFMSALIIFFFNNPEFADTYVKGAGVFTFFAAFAGVGAVLELVAGLLAGTALAKAMFELNTRLNIRRGNR